MQNNEFMLLLLAQLKLPQALRMGLPAASRGHGLPSTSTWTMRNQHRYRLNYDDVAFGYILLLIREQINW